MQRLLNSYVLRVMFLLVGVLSTSLNAMTAEDVFAAIISDVDKRQLVFAEMAANFDLCLFQVGRPADDCRELVSFDGVGGDSMSSFVVKCIDAVNPLPLKTSIVGVGEDSRDYSSNHVVAQQDCLDYQERLKAYLLWGFAKYVLDNIQQDAIIRPMLQKRSAGRRLVFLVARPDPSNRGLVQDDYRFFIKKKVHRLIENVREAAVADQHTGAMFLFDV